LGSDEGVLSESRGSTPPSGGLYNILIYDYNDMKIIRVYLHLTHS